MGCRKRPTMLSAKRNPPYKGSSLGVPNFPGQQKGKSIEQVRDYNKNQVRRKGFRFSGGTTETSFQIKISGTAKFLLGFAIKNDFGGVNSLMLNNEEVLANTDVGFFTLGKTNQDYYAINRPLSGNDDITLKITGDAPYVNEGYVFYYF